MKLVICAVGRLKAGAERDLAERYLRRATDLSPKLGLSGPSLIELPEGSARDEVTRRRQEWSGLATRSDGAVRVALDERGRAKTSAEFASALTQHHENGAKALAFLIGGADGLSPEALEAAHEIISFGAITLPHQLVRIVLLEQIYRALTIRLGHPYHRL